jgi:hypothetical protein
MIMMISSYESDRPNRLLNGFVTDHIKEEVAGSVADHNLTIWMKIRPSVLLPRLRLVLYYLPARH